MTVSVITVCYNSAATIADTVASVAAQTHPEIEHLIIDGASTDATLRVVGSLASKYVRTVSEPDSGLFDAMNKGLRLARGEVIGFLNSDDFFARPDTVSLIAQAFHDPSTQIVYGDIDYVMATDLKRVRRVWVAGRFRRQAIKLAWMPPHPTFYVRRSLLESVGPFDTTLRFAADYDFMLRCLQGVTNHQVRYISETLVRMRLGGATTGTSSAAYRAMCQEVALVAKRQGIGPPSLVVGSRIARVLGQYALQTLGTPSGKRSAQPRFWRATGQEG